MIIQRKYLNLEIRKFFIIRWLKIRLFFAEQRYTYGEDLLRVI